MWQGSTNGAAEGIVFFMPVETPQSGAQHGFAVTVISLYDLKEKVPDLILLDINLP